ncbi:DUF5130 family protein [Pseudonocardia sp. CA-107938]|uniref:DUF5130 family protein n=1 Tax=Pseudonocardia sp. CA-107938 TaxID=3240021 RepID=UPI003D8A57D9
MATGEHGHAVATIDPADLPFGSVVTGSGRVSAAQTYQEPTSSDVPFSPSQLSRLDDALTMASRETGLLFSLYLGDLGPDTAGRAAQLHDQLENPTDAVLVAVSPDQRIVEVVTGPEARLRLPDRGAKLAVMSMIASFKEDDLHGGLLSGLRMLAEQAGGRRRVHPTTAHR